MKILLMISCMLLILYQTSVHFSKYRTMAGRLDVLPFTATKGGRGNDSNPSEPLDENEEQGVNIGGG